MSGALERLGRQQVFGPPLPPSPLLFPLPSSLFPPLSPHTSLPVSKCVHALLRGCSCKHTACVWVGTHTPSEHTPYEDTNQVRMPNTQQGVPTPVHAFIAAALEPQEARARGEHVYTLDGVPSGKPSVG